jgi:hypothetical protein
MAMKSTTERTVKTKFDGDASSGIRAAKAMERELARLDRERTKAQAQYTSDTERGATRVISAFASITKGILAVGSATSSAQGLAGATAAVATLSGTALALPGILAGGAAAGGVLALALSGVGDAIKAKDLEEFNEVTKNMAPNAVKLATAVRDQSGRFTDMKKIVQGNFFEGFDTDVRQLADKYFPVLSKQSGLIATEWNKMGREATKALLDPKSVSAVNSVLGDTRDGLQELRPSLGNVLTGFIQLSSVGSKRLPALSRAVNNLTQDFEDWVTAGVESGRINEIIDEGIAEAKKFGTALGNVGEVGRAVWRGLGAGGTDFAGSLIETTQALEDFFESAEGQQALKTLGETLKVTADVARTIFTTALRELGPVVTELGPVVMEIVRAVGTSLVTALEVAGPLLQSTARFLSENKETVGDLVPLILALAVGYKGLSVAKDAAAWVGGLSTAFGDADKKAKGASDSIGKGSKSGGTGLIGSLAGIAAVVGAGVVIDIVNDSEIAKANDFKISLDGILATIGKIGENGALGLISKYNDAVIGGVGKAISGAQQGSVVLTISSDTSQAERNLNDLKDQIRRSEESVTINGNKVPADVALKNVVAAIDAGEGTVNVNGNTIDSQRALEDLIGQINRSSGTVVVDGNPVPAGQVLFGLIKTISGSRSTMSVDADASAAQGVVNRFITMNNGRQIDIFVNAKGDAGGLASAGRLASGGRPFYNGRVSGPGTRTSDTAGFFALSDDEHVWSAADVAGAGGHGAMYRMRALARQGLLRGFADGGTPAYMTTSIAPPNRAQSVSVAAPNTTVAVFIDGQEFRGIVRTEIEDDKRSEGRKARAGSGAL